MKKESLIVACPTCKKSLVWDENDSFRPFCSERCRLIDLGEWASENRVILGSEKPPQNDEE